MQALTLSHKRAETHLTRTNIYLSEIKRVGWPFRRKSQCIARWVSARCDRGRGSIGGVSTNRLQRVRAICARTYDWIYCAIRILHLTLEGHSTPRTAFDASERDMAIALQSRLGVGHLLMTRTFTNTWGFPLGGYELFGNPST